MLEELNNLKSDLLSEASRGAELRNLYEYQMEINDGLNAELEQSKLLVSTLQKQMEIRQEQDDKRRQQELKEVKKMVSVGTETIPVEEPKQEEQKMEAENVVVIQAVEAAQPTAACLFADDSTDFAYPTSAPVTGAQSIATLSMADEKE